MLKTSGSTYLGKTCIIVWVVWSSATLAPTTSLALSSLTLTPTTFLVPEDDFTISIFIQFYTFLFGYFFKYFCNNLSNWL